MDCDKPLLRPPPPLLFLTANNTYNPPKADLSDLDVEPQPRPINRKQAKREQFMLCHLIRTINEALRYLKSVACRKEGAIEPRNLVAANLSEVYTVYESPTNY
jgi:hypothetical protein